LKLGSVELGTADEGHNEIIGTGKSVLDETRH
jgi:hypothetical protein